MSAYTYDGQIRNGVRISGPSRAVHGLTALGLAVANILIVIFLLIPNKSNPLSVGLGLPILANLVLMVSLGKSAIVGRKCMLFRQAGIPLGDRGLRMGVSGTAPWLVIGLLMAAWQLISALATYSFYGG